MVASELLGLNARVCKVHLRLGVDADSLHFFNCCLDLAGDLLEQLGEVLLELLLSMLLAHGPETDVADLSVLLLKINKVFVERGHQVLIHHFCHVLRKLLLLFSHVD